MVIDVIYKCASPIGKTQTPAEKGSDILSVPSHSDSPHWFQLGILRRPDRNSFLHGGGNELPP